MSKYITYEWRCKTCDHKFDAMTKPDVRVHECPKCGEESKRLISCPRIDPKLGLDPAFGTMADKWERTYMSGVREAERRRDEHGDEE